MTLEDALIDPRTPKEKIFYITFGVKYRNELHPQGMHPDGYAVIIAKDEYTARRCAHRLFTWHGWAFIYDYLDIERGVFDPGLHPTGVLAVYHATKEDENDVT